MKTIKNIFAFVLLAATFTSCDAVDELTKIEVDTTITKDLVITVADGETTFSESASISIDDPDVQDNLDKLEKVEITKLTVEFLNVTGTPDVFVSGDFIASSQMLSFTVLGEGSLTELENMGAIDITDDSRDIRDALEAVLRSGETATLSTSGTVSESPVTFTVRITADVEVTVDAI